jgi:hypothetical protein
VSISPGASFASGSGTRSVDVVARSDAADSGLTTTVDFALGGGAKFDTPNAGTFGGTGFLGEGNIVSSGSSFLRDPLNASVSNLSIEFTNPQLIPSTNTRLATLSIDITGLAVGTYAINITGVDLGGNPGTFNSGSFQITAVPEPSSLLAVGIGLGGLWIRRKLARRIR